MTYIPIIISETFIFLYWIINSGGKIMSDSILNIILAAAAIIGPIITYILSRKSQITKNTEAIQTLARQLGVNDKETFHSEFTKQYKTIIGNIGRGDKATLTVQHDEINKTLEKGFSQIYMRYEKEDESYRQFTAQQLDIKEALDNFSKDYTKVISLNKRLYSENIRLKDENSNLLKRNQELNAKLKRYEAPTMNQTLHP